MSPRRRGSLEGGQKERVGGQEAVAVVVVLFCFGDVPLVEFMCLVFTCIMPDESYLRRLEVVLL